MNRFVWPCRSGRPLAYCRWVLAVNKGTYQQQSKQWSVYLPTLRRKESIAPTTKQPSVHTSSIN